jgi:hypothetical protein
MVVVLKEYYLIKIIHSLDLGFFRGMHDKRPHQTICILSRKMGMVPVGSELFHGEVI